MLKFSASLKAEAEMHISDEQKTPRFSEMLCFVWHLILSFYVVYIFILAL